MRNWQKPSKLSQEDDHKSIIAKIWPIMAEIFFQPFRGPSLIRYHHCLSSYAKLAISKDAISRKF